MEEGEGRLSLCKHFCISEIPVYMLTCTVNIQRVQLFKKCRQQTGITETYFIVLQVLANLYRYCTNIIVYSP